MTLESESIFMTDKMEELPFCRDCRLNDSMAFLYCKNGTMDITCNNRPVKVKEQFLLTILPNTWINDYAMSPNFEFIILKVNASLFEEILFDNFRIEPLWWEKQRYVEKHPAIYLEPFDQKLFLTYLDIMTLYLTDEKKTAYRRDIMHSAVRAMVLEMFNVLDNIVQPKRVNQQMVNQSDYTFREFIRLLQENSQQREVQWFAKKLRITPKYLSEICKMRSGKSASEWITEVTMQDIRQKLLHTSTSIKEVAFQLGFPNSSFFCQYVKKHTGMTPIKLRKSK